MAKKAAKKKRVAVEMTLWDVILSYPDLHDPKPYKGKIYYRTDVLMGEDHAQLKELRGNITKVKKMAWGEDKSEWPEATHNGGNKKLVHDGNEREDQTGYKDRFYITASTQTPVPVVDLKGKAFNAQMVKGGMFANVAVRISHWEYEGDEGVSIYLQGVQIDTSKKSLNFGGGKSVDQMFNLKGSDDDESDDEDQTDDEESDDDEDDQPRGKKTAKKKPQSDDDDEEDEDMDADSDGDEEDERPAKKKKKPSKNFDEDDEE